MSLHWQNTYVYYTLDARLLHSKFYYINIKLITTFHYFVYQFGFVYILKQTIHQISEYSGQK